MNIELSDCQIEALSHMKNGCILFGGVGSGKSRTALAYYLFRVCGGSLKINGSGHSQKMKSPRNLYIITTAKKRDSKEWEEEASDFALGTDYQNSYFPIRVVIDSWNNIKKYKDIYGSFFIFDEQRVVGSGVWVKTFLNITRKNQWILLSATPGDQWTDYIPVFVANGFFRNKTEFTQQHCVYSRFSKYPKIERYLEEKRLMKLRDNILIPLEDNRETNRNIFYEMADYDRDKYRMVFRDRWNPYENEPIKETGKWVYLLRRVVNEDPSRIQILDDILRSKVRLIVFYNHRYELDLIKGYLESREYPYAQWNGKKHEMCPVGEKWVYLVQYAAGCEGWNCISTDTILFYSQNYSYRMTEQAAGRIDRMNTPYKELFYYHIRSGASIDLAIYRNLKNKKTFNESSFVKGWK